MERFGGLILLSSVLCSCCCCWSSLNSPMKTGAKHFIISLKFKTNDILIMNVFLLLFAASYVGIARGASGSGSIYWATRTAWAFNVNVIISIVAFDITAQHRPLLPIKLCEPTLIGCHAASVAVIIGHPENSHWLH